MPLTQRQRAVLEGARQRLERGWTQRAPARNGHGQVTGVLDLQACAWCLMGALVAPVVAPEARWTAEDHACWMALVAIIKAATGTPDVVRWNDARGRTQADVLRLLDEVLA